jgi:hypothetical protein
VAHAETRSLSLLTSRPLPIPPRAAVGAPLPAEADIRRFLDRNQTVLERALAEVERLVASFLTSWAALGQFSVEQLEKARIKEAGRVLAKADRKGCRAPTPCSAGVRRRTDGAAFRFTTFSVCAFSSVPSTTSPR